MSCFSDTIFPPLFKQSTAGVIQSILSGDDGRQNKKRAAVCTPDYRDPLQPEIIGLAMPSLAQLRILHKERATLIESNTPWFGTACVRLVNIAFQTSQMFPSLMSTYLTVSQYIRKQLIEQCPHQDVQIFIADNSTIDFAVGNTAHFALIQQEQYCMLIFSTNRRKAVKSRIDTVNSSTQLQWKSVIVKPLKN